VETQLFIGILPRMAAPSVTGPSRKSRFRKYLVGFLVALVAVYLALCLFIYFQQDQMQFPTLAEYENVTPLNIGVAFEDLNIPVNGSEKIHAWWIPASPPSSKVLEDNITVELRAKSGLAPLPRLPIKQMDVIPLHKLGVNVFAIDYRGYGLSSPGMPNEKRVYDDARAAFTYLTARRGVPSRDIIEEGHSLGTGPATEIAKEHPDECWCTGSGKPIDEHSRHSECNSRVLVSACNPR
jgi:hypothetical protein